MGRYGNGGGMDVMGMEDWEINYFGEYLRIFENI